MPPAALPIQDRARRTRRRILDATVDLLIEEGYSRTTTTRVQAHSGVSRGTLLHHFPTRQDLLVSAVEHLAYRRGTWFQEQVQRQPATAATAGSGIRLLWKAMSGPLFAAATELWVASRTDQALHHALLISERRLGALAAETIAPALNAPDPKDLAYREALDDVLQLFRGAALTTLLRDDARWEQRIVSLGTQIYLDALP